jgi:hypothetical protein
MLKKNSKRLTLLNTSTSATNQVTIVIQGCGNGFAKRRLALTVGVFTLSAKKLLNNS